MIDEELDEIHKDIVRMMIEQGHRTVEDLHPIMREYPFLYKGMSVEDYWKERVYYGKHIKEVHNLTYRPLWKQRGEVHDKFTGM